MTEIDANLIAVIEAWGRLSEPIRKAIVRLAASQQ